MANEAKQRRKPGNRTGRPTLYSDELAATICERIARGANLSQLAEEDQFPTESTLYLWLSQHSAFSEMYARAREGRADARADKIDQVCKDVEEGRLDPNRGRVVVDALKMVDGERAAAPVRRPHHAGAYRARGRPARVPPERSGA